ncbi:MAG: ABC transporter ATP-binding protein [Bacilli bacterium]|nr:ABC transporter ATP-binding protein [Bacilli bacterium]
MNNFSYENLSFYYGKKIIFDNVNIKINRGDVVALVGRNGSGKTTLLKIMAGIIQSNKSRAFDVSFLIEGPKFYPYMTALQNLTYFGRLLNNGLLSIDEALNFVGLTEYKNIKYAKMSLGMKQKLGIALSLMKDADTYLFDEPLNGLDYEGIQMFRRVIEYLKSINKTIVISSHILSELDKYCNKAIILTELHKCEPINILHNKSIESYIKRGLYV